MKAMSLAYAKRYIPGTRIPDFVLTLWAAYPEGYLITKHEGAEEEKPSKFLLKVHCRGLREVAEVLQREGLPAHRLIDLFDAARTILFARAHYVPEALFFEKHYQELKRATYSEDGRTLAQIAPREVRERFEELLQEAEGVAQAVCG